jgi:putative flippase GtrA
MQAIRFGMVGVLNTAIDFAVLNSLMLGFGVTAGPGLLLCNVAAFAVASLNSYLLNKRWTFAEKSAASARQYLRFIAFNFVGLLINSLVLYLVTAGLPRPEFASAVLWANFGKAVATGASMCWNFLTCRRFVFRSGRQGVRADLRVKSPDP